MSKLSADLRIDRKVDEQLHEAAAEKGKGATEDASPGRLSLRLPRLGRVSARPSRLLAVLAALAVVLAVVGGILWRANDSTDAVEHARTAALKAVQSDMETLLSYDYREIDTAVQERADLVTGDFAERYARLVEDQVAPAAKKHKVVTRTEVATASVVDATEDRVDLLLFINQVSATKASDTPVLSGSRIRVEMRLVDGTWRVAAVDPV